MIQQEQTIFIGLDVLDANPSKKKISYSIFMLSRWGRYGLQFQGYHITVNFYESSIMIQT